ncbi:MAG: tRNA preQ1(34) S-adenosylmethionine ribosyltransferase-isomerase QueA [Clostridia bacterium]|nr:tRNA preQ1(34) S-adenosylmethionine ribosyltransferase-isomerase QueA [Clostridia bacterium]
MKTSDFAYDLPEELIAQIPVEPRDSSRLFVVPKEGPYEHRHFYDLPEYLKKGDALVINVTRVMPARLVGTRETGGLSEVLLLRRIDINHWETLVKPGRKMRKGAKVTFGDGRLMAVIGETTDAGGRVVEFCWQGGSFEAVLDELGEMPLPPYIHEKLEDRERYQTVYAKEEGSAAAPTAGLHFTEELLERIRKKGVDIIPVLLHVGLGTFRPVKAENVEEHTMHSEFFSVPEDSAARINAVRERGGRVFAVGTTSVRTLESAWKDGMVQAVSGWTDIFIKPGYTFHALDGIITNFHLPESTLVMLVSAFEGRERILDAYRTAVSMRYRFFSFGDAMLLLP